VEAPQISISGWLMLMDGFKRGSGGTESRGPVETRVQKDRVDVTVATRHVHAQLGP